jgi:hypothetical protein
MRKNHSISSLMQRVGVKASLPALVVTLLLLASPGVLASGKQVRLLIPILTGSELDQVRKIAPSASIVTINGETFLEVGSFTDARVAHRLGRSIQNRLAIPFDLAYDPGHPQIALALGPETSPKAVAKLPHSAAPPFVAATAEPKPQPKPPASDPIWSPLAMSFEPAAPVEPGTEAAVAMAAEANVAATQADLRSVPASKPTGEQTIVQTAIATEIAAAVPVEPEPTVKAPESKAIYVKPANHRMSPARMASRMSQMAIRTRSEARVANSESPTLAASSEAAFSSTKTVQAQQHPWLRPVEIASVKVEVPISRSGVAVNPQLNYIYVKIQQPSDVARINRITPVMELNPMGETLLARVGVFTKSRTGHRLMEARIQQLRQQQVDLIVAEGSTLRELVV